MLSQSGDHSAVMGLAIIDRADVTLANLKEKLLEFLMYVTENVWAVTYHPTDSFRDVADVTKIIITKIEKFSVQTSNGKPFYDNAALMLNKKMWDIISRDKKGFPKEKMFIEWCNKVKECVSFKSLALNMLVNDTTPEQKHDIRYQIIDTDAISGQQRSWINSMLRKHLGDPKVANYILNHGLPGLLDLSLHEQIYSTAILQGMLEEFMSWHVTLLQSIVDHKITLT